MTGYTCRALIPEDANDVKRLHKFAKHNGLPIFSGAAASIASVGEMVSAVTAASDGAFGFASISSDGEVIGAITAQWHGEGDSATCVLLTLVVRADHRQHGVGRQLLQRLEHSCIEASSGSQAAGKWSIITDVAAANDPALQFFLRSNFKRRALSGASVELVLNGDDHAAASSSTSASPGSAATKGWKGGLAGGSSSSRRKRVQAEAHQPARPHSASFTRPMPLQRVPGIRGGRLLSHAVVACSELRVRSLNPKGSVSCVC